MLFFLFINLSASYRYNMLERGSNTMTHKRAEYLREKLYDMYTLLYKAATPSVDFRELVAKSPWVVHNRFPNEYWKWDKDKQEEFKKTFEYETYYPADHFTTEEAISFGAQRKINYDDYYLDKDEYDKIVKDFINDKKNKLSSTEKKQFRTEAYLGCGPTCYKPDNKDEKA